MAHLQKLGYLITLFEVSVSTLPGQRPELICGRGLWQPSDSEGINNKIKRLKRMAYGYRDVKYFLLKIHQHCGMINPRFQT